jgi:copper chaperone
MSTVRTLELDIHGMHCGTCALLIEDVLGDVPGVVSSRTSLTPAHTTVTVDSTQVDEDQILGAIQELGYRPVLAPSAE